MNKISAIVKYNSKPAGILSKEDGIYRFTYNETYLREAGNRPISITMPLRKEPYQTETLFPVFINMLSEGANKKNQSRMLKIDENDHFSFLLATAKFDSIGPLTIERINEPA
ncbi:MAG: phosphatidylinositol kinase [Bacteroidetes bacterium]|nr:MAG: phosphatidylinositol kinase [Bacteroidota bacterium]